MKQKHRRRVMVKTMKESMMKRKTAKAMTTMRIMMKKKKKRRKRVQVRKLIQRSAKLKRKGKHAN